MLRLFHVLFLALIWQSFNSAQAQTTSYTLGTTSLLEGPAAGSDSVVLGVTPQYGTWTATTNAGWLHLNAASGTSSANVIFSFDTNIGPTRIGTLTIGGLTLTVTQAGSNYVEAIPVTTLVSGLSNPTGVAVDSAGNVYFADSGNSALKKWTATNHTVTTLISGVLDEPNGVAVDNAGNVYVADTGNDMIREWNATNGSVSIFDEELFTPEGVAVDNAGNVYFDQNSFFPAIDEWVATNDSVIQLVTLSYPLDTPAGVAVDAAGNVYFADTSEDSVREWSATYNNSSLVGGLPAEKPYGVAVDGSGNVYFPSSLYNAVEMYDAANDETFAVWLSGNSIQVWGVAVDGMRNIYFANAYSNAIVEQQRLFVGSITKAEPLTAGTDTLAVVLPANENYPTPTSDQTWLSINGVTNGVVTFSFTASSSFRAGHIIVLGQTNTINQGGPFYTLGTSNLLEGPSAGKDSVVLAVVPSTAAWTNLSYASWLHVASTNQNGTGSTNALFSFDANPGPTRTGALTIGGQTLTVTQAGSTYVVATQAVTLVSSNLNVLNDPADLAVDSAGNIYIINADSPQVLKWTATNNTVSTLIGRGFSQPMALALDAAGNVYVSDRSGSLLYEWTAANSNLITLASGLGQGGMAVDLQGNVYIAASTGIQEWTRANSNLTTLIPTSGNLTKIRQPAGVAVDIAGNLYILDSSLLTLVKWTAATSNLTTVATGLAGIYSETQNVLGMAVDGSGNVYFAQGSITNPISKWCVTNGSVVTLSSTGLLSPYAATVDAIGNVYMTDSGNNAVKEMPNVWISSPGPRLEGLAAGSDTFNVLPATQNLVSPLPGSTDQKWLTLGGITNGVLSFSFTTAVSNRTGNLFFLNQTIPVTQGGTSYALGTTALVVGPTAGTNSIVLGVTPSLNPWTNTANSPWLHLSAANQSGVGSTNIIFNCDANPGSTRVGNLTVAGQIVTVTQAGLTYVPANPVTTLVSSAPSYPAGMAVDSFGNVYYADTYHSTVKEWNAANNTTVTLVSNTLSSPYGVAVDNGGNVYIADTSHNAIKELIAGTTNVITLVSSGLNSPRGVAVDAFGNVYIGDFQNNAIKKWTAANSNVTTLFSAALIYPTATAVDQAGNVYFSEGPDGAIKEWLAANSTVITLVSSGLNYPEGVAVDGSGNVYIADYNDGAIKEWSAVNNTLTPLISSSLGNPDGVAVDSSGNVYLADYEKNDVKEECYAFVDPTAKTEPSPAGSDALPTVLPATENLLPPFVPTSDQSWLAISGDANDVVGFSFTYNSSSNRTGHISLLGQAITITQSGPPVTAPTLTGVQILGNGAFQFAFTNSPSGSFTVWATTNLASPLTNWTAIGTATNIAAGQFQFTSPPATNNTQSFFRVTSP